LGYDILNPNSFVFRTAFSSHHERPAKFWSKARGTRRAECGMSERERDEKDRSDRRAGRTDPRILLRVYVLLHPWSFVTFVYHSTPPAGRAPRTILGLSPAALDPMGTSPGSGCAAWEILSESVPRAGSGAGCPVGQASA